MDLDVSASKTSPWERPQLPRWLSNPQAYDALVFWRFDRAIRSMGHMYALANWAREHGKELIFAEGLGGAIFAFALSIARRCYLQAHSFIDFSEVSRIGNLSHFYCFDDFEGAPMVGWRDSTR